MTIVIVPPYPQRNDPNFATVADSWNAQLPTWTDQVNATAVDVTSKATTATTQAGIATTQADMATTQAGIATTQAGLAASSAQTAINAPGTNATSTTSVLIGIGSKSLTISTGKLYIPGMYLVVASTSNVSNYMYGQITAYNSGTGELTLSVLSIGGSGTYNSWSISISAPPSAGSLATTTEMQVGTETSPRTMSPKLIADAINYRIPRPHYITSTQSWTIPDTITSVFVQGVGGGANGLSGTVNSEVGAGGGGGGYFEKTIAVIPGTSINITIGASGTNGGTTSFGSHCSATGGSGSEPGVGISGDINLYGGKGFCFREYTLRIAISCGGSSYFGAGMNTYFTSFAASPGQNANNYGAGGSGGMTGVGLVGNGKSGIVIIWY